MNDMKAVAVEIATGLAVGDVILLEGDLGAGKTTLASMIINALCQRDDVEVTSPTFNIMQSYSTPRGEVWHYDLYRVRNQEELDELGIYESMQQAITIIEWPQLALPLVKTGKYIHIAISYAGNGRSLKIMESI